jgi:hypothetical protein
MGDESGAVWPVGGGGSTGVEVMLRAAPHPDVGALGARAGRPRGFTR